MKLTDTQQDALNEAINIAVSRAASSLCDLTGKRVILDPPNLTLHDIDEVPSVLADFIKGDIATIHQIFTGSVAGDAFLMLSHDGAVTLLDLMSDRPVSTGRLEGSDREALTEVGNMLLNTCLSMFGDLLEMRISFTVPRLHMDSLGSLMDSMVIDKEEMQHALIMHTNFRIKESLVGGYLVFVLGVASLERLIQAI